MKKSNDNTSTYLKLTYEVTNTDLLTSILNKNIHKSHIHAHDNRHDFKRMYHIQKDSLNNCTASQDN